MFGGKKEKSIVSCWRKRIRRFFLHSSLMRTHKNDIHHDELREIGARRSICSKNDMINLHWDGFSIQRSDFFRFF